jgi:hypothetical protein
MTGRHLLKYFGIRLVIVLAAACLEAASASTAESQNPVPATKIFDFSLAAEAAKALAAKK